MTPERALDYARRIAQAAMECENHHFLHPDQREALANHFLPILQEAITESVEDHLVSVLAASKGGQA
mgnify:CR=1 FL=1